MQMIQYSKIAACRVLYSSAFLEKIIAFFELLINF